MSNGLSNQKMTHLIHVFQNCKPSVELQSRNRYLNMTQNERVYAICSRREVAGDVISRPKFKTIEGNGVHNFEVASSSIFPRFFKKDHHATVKLKTVAVA